MPDHYYRPPNPEDLRPLVRRLYSAIADPSLAKCHARNCERVGVWYNNVDYWTYECTVYYCDEHKGKYRRRKGVEWTQADWAGVIRSVDDLGEDGGK